VALGAEGKRKAVSTITDSVQIIVTAGHWPR